MTASRKSTEQTRDADRESKIKQEVPSRESKPSQ